MNLTFDISDQYAAVLEAKARAAGMPVEDYLSSIISGMLERQRARSAASLGQHLAWMAAQVSPNTAPEQMEEALQEALDQVRPLRAWQP